MDWRIVASRRRLHRVLDSVAATLLNHVKGELEGTYNLYNYRPERKQALGLWREKLTRLWRVRLASGRRSAPESRQRARNPLRAR